MIIVDLAGVDFHTVWDGSWLRLRASWWEGDAFLDSCTSWLLQKDWWAHEEITTNIEELKDITEWVCTQASVNDAHSCNIVRHTSVIASVAAGALVLPEEFKLSDMVLVWPTTVLPRVRLMLILRQMVSAELDRLLLLSLVLEVTPSDMLSLDRRDSLSDLQPRLWVRPKRGAQAYHHLQHHHQDRGWQIISQTFVNMLSQEEYLSRLLFQICTISSRTVESMVRYRH